MYRVRNQIACTDDLLPQNASGKVTVAVLDTGISRHPDFSNRIIEFKDFVNDKQYIYDDCGHGTHVAGCIGGDGKASGGKYRGIHPMCNFIIGKILNAQGDGELDALVSGIKWVLECAKTTPICAINISLGLAEHIIKARMKEVVCLTEEAWAMGIPVICAAGNSGPKTMSLSLLGAGECVICVGCHEGGYFGNRPDLCEHYSGRGPSAYALKKPDIVAPGTDIISCNSKYIATSRHKYKNAYIKKSGTSMATPIVTGAIALMTERNGKMSCDEIKRRLVYSATDLKEPWEKQGWGMIHVKRFVEMK